MRKTFVEKLYDFILKYPFIIILFSLLLSALFFMSMQNLPLKSDFIELLPQTAEPVRDIKILSQKLKGVGQFSIVLESPSGNADGMKKLSDALYADLVNTEEVDFIQYKLPVEFIRQNSYFFVDTQDLKTVYKRLHEKISYEIWKEAPIYLSLEEDRAVEFKIDDIIEKYKNKKQNVTIPSGEYFLSNDNKMLALFLKPDFMPTETQKTEKLINKIKLILNEIDAKKYGDDIKITFGGTYALSYDQKNAILNDIKLTSILSLIIVFLIMLFFIKNLFNSLALLYALFFGVLSSFGFAFIVYHHINLITGFLIAILTGLGVNYGMHFLLRYNEEKQKITDNKLALKKSFISTINPSSVGAVTTACSFLILAFSKFLGFSEFGLLAGTGIIVTLLAAYLIVTSFLVLFTGKQKLNIKKKFHDRKIIKKEKSNKNFSAKEIIIVVSSLFFILTVIFVYKIKDLSFEYDSKKLEVKSQESIRITELIQKKFNISTDPAIFYTHERKEEKELYRKLSALMKEDDSLIGSIMSLSAILPDEDVQKEKIKWVKLINKELKSLPKGSIKDDKLRENISLIKQISGNAKVITEKELPDTLKKRVLAFDGDKTIYIIQVFPKKILFDAKEMRRYVEEVKSIEVGGKSFFATGMHILYVYLIDTVLHESRIFISLIFFIIWLIVLLDLKSFKESFIVLIPLVFGILWLLIVMSVFKVKFNFMNIIVLPTVLGTGVDNGVHLYHRYKSSENILDALQNTGFANFGMSITVALGWSSLFFAHYEGLKTMGFVGVVGILTTFLASITIMPSVIILTDYLRNKK